jgi:hypothetical protein
MELMGCASSLRDIATGLNERGIPTARGTGTWSATQAMRVPARLITISLAGRQELPQLHSSLAVTMPSPQAGMAGEGVVIPALVAAAPPLVP